MLDAGHRRALDGQRPAPRVAQRPDRRAQRRRACARRCPTRCSAGPTRSCSSTSRPRRCSSACARARSTPERDRRRAERLLPDREPHRAARDRAAPGRRGGRGQAPRDRDRRHARGLAGRRPPQAVGERLLALVRAATRASQRLVRRAWRSAQRLGAELDVLWVAPAGGEPNPDQQRQLARAAPAGVGARRAPGRRVRRRRRRHRRARRPRARHHLHPGRRVAPGPRPGAACASRCPSGSWAALPGVDVRIVADRARRHEKTP